MKLLDILKEQMMDADFGTNPNVQLAYEKINPKILMLMSPYIPVIGPIIMAGIIGNELKQDYVKAKTTQEKTNIILSYVISMAFAWGLAKVFKSMSELGEEGMKMLSRKMRTLHGWKMLSTKEGAVLMDLTNGPQYWQNKLKSIVK